MSWEAGPFNPLRSEIFMPPLSETGARLTFAPFGIKSWSELSDWYHNLAEPSLQKRNGLEELAAGLTADLKTDEDKLKALFEWTRDQIRYIAVEIGIGGYQPSPAEEVLAVRYGDCKDMTTLLCALAEEINIPVYPALISTRQNGIPDTTLPSATQFNHIIAFAPTIGSGGTWMDATEKSCGFRSLPWYDQDMPVLLIAPDGNGRLLRTPASNPEDNRSETRWQVQLFPDGIAEVTATASYCGVVADEIRHILRSLSRADRFEWQEQILAERTSGARLDSLRVLNLDTPGLPLEIYYTFKDPDIFQQLPGLMILEPGILSGERLYALFRPEKRIHPVRLQIPAESSFSLSLDLPEDWYPAIASNQLIQESSYGTCRFTWKFHDRRLETGVWVTTPAQEIFPAEYLDFLAYLQNSRIILETPIQILHNPDE
jgi:hypothetical protein